jgi:hypothetical protein
MNQCVTPRARGPGLDATTRRRDDATNERTNERTTNDRPLDDRPRRPTDDDDATRTRVRALEDDTTRECRARARFGTEGDSSTGRDSRGNENG